MIVRTLQEVAGSERDVDWGNGKSRRFLAAADGMSFSLTDTIVKAGSQSLLEYRNHLEACYCVEGEGEVHDRATGAVHRIAPGTMYALNRHDQHWLIAKQDMRLVCVFSPPLRGNESHRLGSDGSSSY